MALAEYIKDLERGVYGEKEGETLALSKGDDNIPSEKLDSNFLAMLPTLVSIVSDREKKKKDEPIYRREIDPYPPPQQQQQQGGGGGGGLSPLEIWDLYKKYKGEGASESASSGTSTSGTGSTTAYSSGYPVQGMAGGQATAGSQGLGYMGGTGATAAGSQGLGYMGGTGATGAGSAGAGAAGAGSAAMAAWIAAAAIAASYMQKQRDKEEKSEDPGRGSGSRKARIMSAIGGPSILETLDDPISIPWTPLTALMGVGSGSKGDTESEGTKIWDWLGKLF
jgi:hypothetical protein